ncbi:BREX system Lon protease-like protein BrxL [Empedobacter falsenii]
MKPLDEKINQVFEGKVVRKDLTSKIKGNAIVPTYVLEYLLGQYCATDNEETITDGIGKVKAIIEQHFVHRDEAEEIKSKIREKGNHRIIDKISVKLNDNADRYEAQFANLGLKKIPINDAFVKQHPKLLSEGVWSLTTMGYEFVEEKKSTPWVIENVKPIQIVRVDLEEYFELRNQLSTDEWINLLMQSIGLNFEEFSDRSKLIQLSRLIPFCENNFNLIELGPKGTGKSHIYSELSPHGILISGGEVSKAKLFVNNSTGDIGLVGYWDVVAYDEFAGKGKTIDRGLVDILKNYMANKSFSRGTNVYQAEASMVFVGNTNHSVQYMEKHSNLFEVLPKEYYDTAFLDRIHLYLPGWEVSKLRNELFTHDFGFIVDYLAEVLKHLRKKDYSKAYQEYFKLSDTITTRDKTGIEKTFSGLVKILFPDGNFTKDECKNVLDFAIEGRKRVKLQLQKMDETFNDEVVKFEYNDVDTGVVYKVDTLEELEYGDFRFELVESESVFAPNETKLVNETKLEEQEKPIVPLTGFSKSIRDNQTNITYDRLFGYYLEGAKEFTIQDPFIRMPHQFRNFMELCALILKKNEDEDQIKIHLITYNTNEYMDIAMSSFREMQLSLEEMGVEFTFEMSETAHDRSIICNNGWKIILGRGLDIWQKTSRYDLAEILQEKRKCKEFDVVVIDN